MRGLTAVALALSAPAWASAWGVDKCDVPATYNSDQLRFIADRNCASVDHAVQDFNQAVNDGKELNAEQKAAWTSKSSVATEKCDYARSFLRNNVKIQEAASLALDAWGVVIMGGVECCSLLQPPYCTDMVLKAGIVADLMPVLILVLLFCGSILANFCVRKRSAKQASLEKTKSKVDLGSVGSAPGLLSSIFGVGSRASSPGLDRELKDKFIHKSCLRVLPGADSAAKSSATVFSSLCDTFDFQADSVRSQYDHFLSLWRSQVAMVADRYIEDKADVDEATLLGTALGDLHADLLDGFLRWRAKLAAHEPANVPPRKPSDMPPMAGAKLDRLGADVADATPAPPAEDGTTEDLSVKLAEIATFLCVWAECGNVRFMPEVVYFITEMALAAKSGTGLDRSERSTAQSCLFLSKVVRPIYNAVFDEWYEKVGVNADGKDAKALRTGYDAFLPPNVANYDDWNELFCDPERLVAGVLLEGENATPLFELPHEERFAALAKVDWQITLLAAATKTHREVHSLWGVFASTHRIWLAHSFLFFALATAMADVPDERSKGQPFFGYHPLVRFAAVGMVVPLHAMLWWVARWQITGVALRPTMSERMDGLKGKWVLQWFNRVREQPSCLGRLQMIFCTPPDVVALFPVATYIGVRCVDDGTDVFVTGDPSMIAALVVHAVFTLFALFHLLLVPSGRFMLWKLTHVPKRSRAIRYLFWICVFAVKGVLAAFIFAQIHDTLQSLHIARLGFESPAELWGLILSTKWWANTLLWFVLWSTMFLLFCGDTQLWFTLGCTILGVVTVFKQRGWSAANFCYEDAMGRLPERFSKKVLYYSQFPPKKPGKEQAHFSSNFPLVWDRIVAYMRYEDDIDTGTMADLSFDVKAARDGVVWEDLNTPLHQRRGSVSTSATSPTGGAAEKEIMRVKMPHAFRGRNASETCFHTYCCVVDRHEPSNPDVVWRLAALGRGLGLPLPRPFRGPYFPGITVLIPHYGEQILMTQKELFTKDHRSVNLIHWLYQKYDEEFLAFANRMRGRGIEWPVAGDQWSDYSESQWERVTGWASMRMQTLWRTVAGMCYYYPALQCHFEAQGDRNSSLAREGVWDARDCFTCLVSMQMYNFFNKAMLHHTDRMLEKFPSCLKIAFIDCKEKGDSADHDRVHARQERRYYSCLIDRTCATASDGLRVPIYSVEQPGYPILGDGKGDNQNHAIPYMRGHFSQCIDANQGAYFEQMMLLPCALGEFRSHKRGDGLSKRIVGFPEHITSDIGSIGDFAASAEVAFGTILQRTYSVLGARMHYGHPDIMNKLFMMQQGGVSKATKTINLSEDIFAGMDFTLRGDGRGIKHCEYFHLAKGRDMGFNAVLGFFSKLSSGTGEQLLSRQTFRLGQVLHLPEAFAFYYAHAGYYVTQFFVSCSMPLLVYAWLLVLVSDCEGTFDAFLQCSGTPESLPGSDWYTSSASVMANFLTACFSWLVLLFLVANSTPLLAELWLEVNLKGAMTKFFISMCTLSPLMFIFQAKTIGYYIVNEFRYGGASYVATGRGLPTERRPLIFKNGKGEFEGLLLDYARIAYYDGATLLSGIILVHCAGGEPNASVARSLSFVWLSAGLTVTSWLWAPFVFNPYNFSQNEFREDLKSLGSFFLSEGGKNWDKWYERTFTKGHHGVGRSMNDIGFFVTVLLLAAWYATLNLKAEAFLTIYSEQQHYHLIHAAILLPPLFSSLLWSALVVMCENLYRCKTVYRNVRDWAQEKAVDRIAGDPTGARSAEIQRRANPAAAAEPSSALSSGAGAGEGPSAAPAMCVRELPLAISAVMVLALDVAEAVLALYFFHWVGWQKAFIAGLILKCGLMCICLFLAENILASSNCVKPAMVLPLRHWVRAHRMARDILVFLLIALPQIPLVLLNALNDYVCPGCSAHQLLIYRDPGTVDRQEKIFDLESIAPPVATAPEAVTMPVASPRDGSAVASSTRSVGSHPPSTATAGASSARGAAEGSEAPPVPSGPFGSLLVSPMSGKRAADLSPRPGSTETSPRPAGGLWSGIMRT